MLSNRRIQLPELTTADEEPSVGETGHLTARRIGLALPTLAAALLLGLVGVPAVAQPPLDPGSKTGLTKPSSKPTPAALRALSGCDTFRDYLGEALVETLVAQRYGDPVLWWGPLLEGPSGFGEGDSPAPGDFTSTNNQEEGVDELDLVKTDGLNLYLAQQRRFDVVRAWPPEESALVSSLDLPGWKEGLFLDGDRALVVSSWPQAEIESGRWVGTRLDLVDVSDPGEPGVVRSLETEGYLVGARKIGSRVFVVLQSQVRVPEEIWGLVWRDDLGLPEIGPDATEAEREAASEVARSILRPLVDGILEPLGERDLLPLLQTTAGGAEPRVEPLLGCGDFYRLAKAAAMTSLLAVLTIDLDSFGENGDSQAAGVMADGWTIYASLESLYIARSSFWWWGGWGELVPETVIHRFDLGGEGDRPVRYAATGEVPGFLLDQFSMDEHEGHLRVATTEFDWWWGTSEEDPGSRITVLREEKEGILRKVGEVAGIAPGERIFASRFLGDKGYLVTFQQIDPLFTLDLSDPTDPRVVGELELPGFSAYLHPIGDGHLLAVGRAGQEDGTLEGVAVNLFDVRDFEQPVLAFQQVLEKHFSSEALNDHHAFTYHRDVLSIPALAWSEGHRSFSGLLVFRAHPEDGIQELGRIDHRSLGGGQSWMRRSVYIEDAIYSISTAGIKVNDLLEPTILYAEVPLP